MSCQDPLVADGVGSQHAASSTAVPSLDDAYATAGDTSSDDDFIGAGGYDWTERRAFRDRGLSDDDFKFAMRRAAPGDVRRLVVCSSRLTDAGVAAALEPHWAELRDLCLSNCGRLNGDGISGAVLAPLLICRRRALQRLVLLDVPAVPLAAVAAACRDLRAVMLRGALAAAAVESLSRCPQLEVLKLTLEPKVSEDSFMRVFTACRRLRVIDICGATTVTDQLLGCIVLNIPCLDIFRGCHAGCGFSRALSERMEDAFRKHFHQAQISIDNLVQESLL